MLATVLFTDIVDSTATAKRLGDLAWRDLLSAHNARLRAVQCAAAMTRSAHEVALPIRAGVHTGELEFVGGDLRGIAVHTAQRVMSLAGQDERSVSSTTRDLLEGSGLRLEDAGVHELKGLGGHRQLFRLMRSGATAEVRS